MTDFLAPYSDQWNQQVRASGALGGPVRQPANGAFGTPALSPIVGGWSNGAAFWDNDESNVVTWVGATGNSQQVYLNTYGFDVPTAATIVGVEVFVKSGNISSANVKDRTVQLALAASAATLSATNQATGVAYPVETTRTYGGPTDMWGETSATLTPAIVNSSNFGVVFGLLGTAGAGSQQFRSITIKVYYSVTVDGDPYITQQYAEAIVTKTEPARITQQYAEAIVTKTEPARLTQLYVEVIRSVSGSATTTAKRRSIYVFTGD